MSQECDLSPEEEELAMNEARSRGLPDGWAVKLDKRKRRKWISPNGRRVDSIPKALAMSVTMGLISPDTPIRSPSSKRAGPKSPKPIPVEEISLEGIPPEIAATLPPMPIIKKRGPGRPSKKDKLLMQQQQKQIEQYRRLTAQAQALAKQQKEMNRMQRQRPNKRSNFTYDETKDETDDEYGDDAEYHDDGLGSPAQRKRRRKSTPKAEASRKATAAAKAKAQQKKLKTAVASTPEVEISTDTDDAMDDDDDQETDDENAGNGTFLYEIDDCDSDAHAFDDDDRNHAGKGEDSDGGDDKSTECPTNPETTLRVDHSHLTTVHWDPNAADGRRIGWRVRIADNHADDWKAGRIIRYDPCTHKHKIQFTGETRSVDKVDRQNCAWLHLRVEEGVQIATKLVWAHVKGYAWWPAMVMDSDAVPPKREGYLTVEFFGTAEVATLRIGPESIRPFMQGHVDDIMSKNKKKRNAHAVQLALEEEAVIYQVRNDAARFYAKKAMLFNSHVGNDLVGRRVEVFRDDINYPYGETLCGKVRLYSPQQKKWLVSYEMSTGSRKKQEPSWIDLQSKQHKTRIFGVKSGSASATTSVPVSASIPPVAAPDVAEDDIVPFLVGYRLPETDVHLKDGAGQAEAHLVKLCKTACRACVDSFKPNETKLQCVSCKARYHIGCVDPPLSKEDYQRMAKSGDVDTWKCSKCITCRGCYQKDIAFGCSTQPVPCTVSFPEDESFDLCSMCIKAYAKSQYCPNCAHSWDDEHYQCVQRQVRWLEKPKSKKRSRKRKSEEPVSVHYEEGTYSAPANTNLDDTELPLGAHVNPTWYFPETAKWGFTEVDMLTCDACKLWVHAGCAGLNEEEYDLTSSGKHSIYGKEFLCRVCCRKRCIDIIQKLQAEDSMLLFAEPVTDRIAANYLDVIKYPMDLQTLAARVHREEYGNYAWVRDMFELMVLNALTFNHHNSKFWMEAKRFHEVGLSKVFSVIGKAAPVGKYDEAIQSKYREAEEAKKKEADRVQQDESTQKKDPVGGTKVVTVTLPKLRDAPPDQGSCMAFREILLKPIDAYYTSWLDCCFTCGSCGASDTMLHCVDCGEAFHSFCVNAPIHSMDPASVAGWRCQNCKICEISGDDPQDELKMLFCEMCDRAFSLDLLDPPLQSAPSGLWICGQCVDCEKCDNTSEPKGASLQHWSRDPRICFRCGGCDGLLDPCMKGRKCPVCNKLWRDGDTDIAQCEECGIKVHGRCEVRANLYLLKKNSGKAKDEKYFCPTCSKKQGNHTDFGKVTRDHMHDLSWKVIIKGILKPSVESSHLELQEKLMDQVDWKTRNLYRDEYRKVVLEGVRFLDMARDQYGDPRLLMDRFWRENLDLPTWMGQRATRFIHIAKRLKLTSQGFSARRIENCVLISKLAASWLKVACRTLEINTKKNVKGYERARKLLVPPHACGALMLPFDNIRCERNRNIINKDEWGERFEPELRPYVEAKVLMKDNDSDKDGADAKNKQRSVSDYKIAEPLCGWNDMIKDDAIRAKNEWKDPRECCLCHICGDDDAGMPSTPPRLIDGGAGEAPLKVPKLGRLLPMGDGFWVHSLCAFYSSETWLAPPGGHMKEMEKARSRGAQLKCFGCGRSGATVGCSKTNCSYNYHFPCAVATGCVFTKDDKVFCAQHKNITDELNLHPSEEHMKALIIAPEKSEPSEAVGGNLCIRVGALVVHALGEIVRHSDCFHSEDYITPKGYIASRIYWSSALPKHRTVYILKIEQGENQHPVFSATPGDRPGHPITGTTADEVYRKLVQQVETVNKEHFSHGDMFSKLPAKRISRKRIFGLNGPQFFGFGLNIVRRALEICPGSEALVTPMTDASSKYKFCYSQPTIEAITTLQRERAAIAAEKELENVSGCARTEGMKAVTRSGGSGRITRALVRNADNDQLNGIEGQSRRQEEETSRLDRSINQRKYREMKAVPIEQRLAAKRSHIHGWGLFAKLDLPKDSMVIEYMGEVVRRCVADKREKAYEISGEGSCYMFRLDLQRIVDATTIGCMARFMNHSCQPNAYAKVITVETELGQEKKIMVFSKRDIAAGDEITYDYKFPVEDGSLRCTCGAPNCIGRMN